VVERQHAVGPALDEVERGVRRDPVQPRPQRAGLLLLVDRPPRAQQRVLEGVLGVLADPVIR
jgi:hypothetical protein